MKSHPARRERIERLYSPAAFLEAGRVFSEEVAKHYQRLQQREVPVLNWRDPAANVVLAMDSLRDEPHDGDWLELFRTTVQTILDHGQNLHHPRYLGHQVPASIPLASLFDAVGSATNQVMAIYEMGPWSTAVEHAMVRRLSAEVGFDVDQSTGLVTSGGSLANLTALLTARNVTLDQVWRKGISNASELVMVVQHDVHYSVVRAAGVLGIGTDQVCRIPVDARRKMRVDRLEETLQHLQRQGRHVCAVVAGACATPIGAFDPLDQIADVCQRYGVWMHVDAAHGGAALLSSQHRHLLAGIERADSVVWDAHKMLFMPALCAFVLLRDKQYRFAAFEQDAPYLFDPTDPGVAEYDNGTQTMECTKRAATFALWGIWSIWGRQIFTDLVEESFAMTQRFHQLLHDADDFLPLHVPECNIQVFRHVPLAARDWAHADLASFQLKLRQHVVRSGKAYIVPIRLDGQGALRATLINPLTNDDDLQSVLDAIRDSAESLLSP